jgi:hypothetical protein
LGGVNSKEVGGFNESSELKNFKEDEEQPCFARRGSEEGCLAFLTSFLGLFD